MSKKVIHAALWIIAGGVVGYIIGKNAATMTTTAAPAKTS